MSIIKHFISYAFYYAYDMKCFIIDIFKKYVVIWYYIGLKCVSAPKGSIGATPYAGACERKKGTHKSLDIKTKFGRERT